MRENDLHIDYVEQIFAEALNALIDHLPIVQRLTAEIIDTVLAPKVVARQLALVIALDFGLVTVKQLLALIQSVLSNFSSRKRLIRQLQREQQQASTQEEWFDLAERIDQIQGNDVWRSDPNCLLYERDRISSRIDEIVHLMRRQNVFDLMFVLRGSIGRNKFGLLHSGLFTKALAGTKVLVETYHNVICQALDFVCDSPVLSGDDPIPTEARLAFFNETRHAYGRTALLLSGGAALGFYHAGVVRTLMENGLMPRVIGGSSAGSILCAMIGTRTDEECMNDMFHAQGTNAPGHSGVLRIDFFRPLTTGKHKMDLQVRNPLAKNVMEVYDNTASPFQDFKRFVQGCTPIPIRRFSSYIYDICTGHRRAQDMFKNDTEHFRNCVRLNVGNFTFQEAFDRTGRILNIVVTPQNSSDPPRLLNYLTAPHVMVWSAAVASSSLPGVFEANRLVVKEADGWERYESGIGMEQSFSDGSMEQDLPMTQLSEMFNVNHFIISQANPHAVAFASYNSENSVWSNPVTGMLEAILKFLRDQVRTWVAHLVDMIGARRIAPIFERKYGGIGSSFVTQEYEGRSIDISLIPWLGHRSLFGALMHIIYNPSEAEYREWLEAAARETWKYIPAIKSHIAEEITLDRCVQRLRKRLIQESWERRINATTTAKETKVKDRVPSFYTSPSLVNMGGLNIGDQLNIEFPNKASSGSSLLHNGEHTNATQPQPISIPDIDINSGWGGMGLRGNRSSSNLRRTASDASGLFIDDEEQHPSHQGAVDETVAHSRNESGKLVRARDSEGSFQKSGYVKTTSMAHFYYRRDPSFSGVCDMETFPRTSSDTALKASTALNGKEVRSQHHRRRSKSHADLFS